MHPADVETLLHSGRWRGFFLDARQHGQHPMELTLSFHAGRVLGDGRDAVGAFDIEGRYSVDTGECSWRKRYETHVVVYRGFAEHDSIWGTWRLADHDVRGGFQLWPVPGRGEPATLAAVASDDAAG